MKRILYVLCAMLLLLCSCGMAEEPASDRLQIVATSFAPYDFARAVAGDMADISMLLPPGSESHSFEPTAQDIIRISNCDVFIYVGGESDAWIEGILDSIPHDEITMIRLMPMIECLYEDHDHGIEEEEHVHTHEEHEEYDEHIWTSPVNAITITQGICDVLCEVDGEHADTYQANAKTYIAELEEIDHAFRDVVQNAQRHEIIFGDRFPFLYFVREYGLSYHAAFPGCASQTEPSAATLAYLIDCVKQEGVPVVLKAELSSDKIANAIAEATGTNVMTFYACHNISAEDMQEGRTYASFMWENVETLKEALN